MYDILHLSADYSSPKTTIIPKVSNGSNVCNHETYLHIYYEAYKQLLFEYTCLNWRKVETAQTGLRRLGLNQSGKNCTVKIQTCYTWTFVTMEPP